MSSPETQHIKTWRAELVVIGGGAAGLAAAVTSAETGLKDILVLESRRNIGGNGVFPWGIFGLGSSVQQRQGIEVNVEKVFREAVEYTHWRANPTLIRRLMEKSGDTIGWLATMGPEFVLYPPGTPGGNAFFHVAQSRKKTGAVVMEAMARRCRRLGVRMMRRCRANRILMNGQGAVRRVEAQCEHGLIQIETPCVIIATGGLAGNEAMIRQFLPSFQKKDFRRLGLPHQGDGIRMARAIGAKIDDHIVLEMMGPNFPKSKSLFPLLRRGYTVWLNRLGERFVDESVSLQTRIEGANAIYRQPGRVMFNVFDDRIRRHFVKTGLSEKEKKFFGKKEPLSVRVERNIEKLVEKSCVYVADTLDGLAQWIGANPEVLQRSIANYNLSCKKGVDDLFFKEAQYLMPIAAPPFYAMKCGLDMVVTRGGIVTNHHMQVVDSHYQPIPGLYAAGVETSGIDGDTYDARHMLGHSFGFSVTGGRLAGEEAALYLKK